MKGTWEGDRIVLGGLGLALGASLVLGEPRVFVVVWIAMLVLSPLTAYEKGRRRRR